MGEGIESTLTPMAHAFEENTAYWAGVDLGNMSGRAARDFDNRVLHAEPDLDDVECFLPPSWCAELVYLCDGDDVESHMMDKIARGLARARTLRQRAIEAGADLAPLAVSFVPAPGPGQDINDLARAASVEPLRETAANGETA